MEIGPSRKDFAVGQRISMAPAVGCGARYPCSRGFTNLCGNVYRTPDGVPDEEAALSEPIASVVNGQEFLHIDPGDSVAVFGPGFIGCMHAELARMKGARPIIMIEPNKARAEAAHALIPFSSLIVSSATDLHAEVERLTGGRGVDVIVTACPVGQAQKDALSLSAKRGRISLFGGLANDTSGFLDSSLIHYKELSIHGVHASTPRQNQEVMKWIAAGKLNVRKYITRIYPLETIETAFRDLQSQSVFKAVVKPTSSSDGMAENLFDTLPTAGKKDGLT